MNNAAKGRMRKPKKKKKSEKTLTLPEAHEAWERFWSNTRILGFEVGKDGEKHAIRTGIQRVMPGGAGLDFRNKK